MTTNTETQLVVAIDFGTTYTGYAISTYSDYKIDPLKIITEQWRSDEMCTEKTTTCILFDKYKNFHSFGYNAERKYAELAEDECHEGWRFFKHFKLMLIQAETQRLRRNITIKDDQCRPMRALHVFSASIRYMKEVVLRKMQNAIMNLKESDFHWVLTVPAIWEDGAKQFMRIAANEAGIKDELLTLALEPEAAAIYCKQITTQTAGSSLSAFEPGTKFLLLDLGGGTVDCVVEQVEENGHLTDIHCPDGGPWGGTLVDTAFKHFLDEVFGETSVENFSNKYKSDELFIYSNFEIKKRNITTTSSERIRLRIPSRLAECSGGNAGVQHRIKQSKYQNDVEVLADKLIVDSKIFVHMFSESKRKLIEFIHSLFKEDEISGIDLIILVGGFACSPLIVDAVKNSFSDKHVIVPNDANLAVLKGAVLYGRLSLNSISQTDSVSAIISARHMRYTYGISTAVPFDDQKHSQAHKIEYEGRIPECENVFHVFFKAGQRVVPGKASETCVFNLTRLSNEIEVYRTRSKDPKYINDEGCFMIGNVMLKAFDHNGKVEVTFHAGETELTVEAIQAETETAAKARFNFLI